MEKVASESGMLGKLIEAFDDTKVEVTYREIADIVWLAAQMKPRETTSETPAAKPVGKETKPRPDKGANQADKPTPTHSATNTHLFPASRNVPRSTTGASSIRVPGVFALPEPLDIGRALRPFMRRFPSKRLVEFDEEATVENFVPGLPKAPMFKPALERWFRVAIVVEDSPTMAVWGETLNEFERMLGRHGAFEDVRRWRVMVGEDRNPRWFGPSNAERTGREVVESGSRSLVLFVTDCVSSAWRAGAFDRVLAEWGRMAAVAVIQLLPERLWPRTALGGLGASARCVQPGAVNTDLIAEVPGWSLEPRGGRVPIPVVSLYPASLSGWSRVVMGRKGQVPALMVSAATKPREAAWPEPSPSVSAKTRIENFRKTVSPEAYQLAVYFSEIPLTMSVMRLVQHTMSPDTRLVHLGEVFLGGILRTVRPEEIGCGPEAVEYQFHDGVRELLQRSIRRTERSRVCRAVSEYVEKHFGQTRDFPGLRPDPEGKESLPEEGRAVAEIPVNIVEPRRASMFERYTQKARRVIFFARYEASQFKAPAIFSEHLLLGVMREDTELDHHIFVPAQISTVFVRNEIEARTIPREHKTETVDLPLSPDAKRVLAFAEEESERLNHRHIGPEHLLLGLLREETGLAARILMDRGLRLGAVRRKIQEITLRSVAAAAFSSLSREVRNGIGMEFVLVPAGKFLMGGNGYDDEKPIHEVTISRPFYLGKYQVTIGEYLKFCRETNTHWPEWLEEGSLYHIRTGSDDYYKAFVSEEENDRRPVVGVSWNDAAAFCEWLGKREGVDCRLPSEAEWEYACRAGTTGDYAGDLDAMGWYGDNSGDKPINSLEIWEKSGRDWTKYWNENLKPNGNRTHPVGGKRPNGWGLYDMHGNVWEWCEDVWHDNYTGAPTDGRAWTEGGNQSRRVLRGGSWIFYSDFCRSAYRGNDTPDGRSFYFGFRVMIAPRTQG